MKTDRELLELAAKAAGIVVEPHANYKLSKNLIFISNGKNWNPLTDDGDALRLAVKLKLCIDRDFDRVDVFDNKGINETEFFYEKPISTDTYAATRRAIVRAASEIGKEMP